MARTKEFDTVQTLRKAMEIFGRYGYEGTSLQNLLDGLGIARQSLYDTYGTKRDLFLSAVKHYVNGKTEAVVARLERPGSVKDAIADIFREAAAVLKDESRRNECFILHSAIDQMPRDSELAAFLRQDIERVEQALLRALERGAAQGELDGGANLRALARYLNHARYSLTQSAKMTDDPAALDDIAATVLAALDRS